MLFWKELNFFQGNFGEGIWPSPSRFLDQKLSNCIYFDIFFTEKRIPLVGKYASFKFSEHDANGNLHKWLEGRWFAPNHFSEKVSYLSNHIIILFYSPPPPQVQPGRFFQMYVPFYVFRVQTVSSYYADALIIVDNLPASGSDIVTVGVLVELWMLFSFLETFLCYFMSYHLTVKLFPG